MNSFTEGGISFKVEAAWKKLKKRSLAETGMNEHENHSGLDLELKLSPPGSSPAKSNTLKSTGFPALLPSSASHGAYLSPMLNLNLEKNFGGISKYEPPLVVMGCDRCLMYVMVSKAKPKCPKCKNFKLIDEFEVNPAKKMRTSCN